MKLFRRQYGTTPLHLLGHIACFGIAAYVIAQLLDARRADNILLWFVGAILLHDMLFLPFYSGLDRVARRGVPGKAINFVRVPAMLSGLLFLVYFPAILSRNDGSFARVSGHTPTGHFAWWLLLTGLFFAVSAVTYVVKGRRAAAPPPPAP